MAIIAARNSAISPTKRAMMPTVSRASVLIRMPAGGNSPKLGLNPTTPQYAAGRITEPPVWVPIASGTIKSATAAAEPLDEPPGEKSGLCGFVVGPGCRLANSVVTVLPSRIPPAARGKAAALASLAGRHPTYIGDP